MGEQLRWGFLGTGNIARQFLAGIHQSPRATLVAVGSRDPQRALQFIEEHRLDARGCTYDEVLASPSVDVVYVALPNSMHHEWTLKALKAGKHVLCEKPIASNVEQAREMFDAAKRADRVLMEAFMYRSHPLAQAVVKSVRRGAIGQVRMIRTSFSFRTRKPEGNVRFSREMAGGSLMDVGCYCIDFSRWIAGAEPTAVHAIAQLHFSGVDEVVCATMVFPGNLLATFSCGLSAQSDNTAYICGTEGYIEVPILWKPPARNASFTIHRQPPPLADNIQTSAAQLVGERFVVDSGKELFTHEVDDFSRTVLEGAPPRLLPADSLGTMEVLDQLRRQLGVID